MARLPSTETKPRASGQRVMDHPLNPSDCETSADPKCKFGDPSLASVNRLEKQKPELLVMSALQELVLLSKEPTNHQRNPLEQGCQQPVQAQVGLVRNRSGNLSLRNIKLDLLTFKKLQLTSTFLICNPVLIHTQRMCFSKDYHRLIKKFLFSKPYRSKAALKEKGEPIPQPGGKWAGLIPEP